MVKASSNLNDGAFFYFCLYLFTMIQIKTVHTLGSEIVTLAEAKNYIRVETDADNMFIIHLIEKARVMLENYLSVDIVAKERQYFNSYVDDIIRLPFTPATSIKTVTVLGSTATYKNIGIDKKIIKLNSLPAEEVLVTYQTEGLNDAIIKQSILKLVNILYDHRAETDKGTVSIPNSVKSDLSIFKEVYF